MNKLNILLMTGDLTGFFGFLLGVALAVVFGCVALVLLLGHILLNLGLRSMLGAVGCDNSKRALLPIVNIRAFGELADLYDNGKCPSKYKKALPSLAVIALSVFAIYLAFTLAFVVVGMSTKWVHELWGNNGWTISLACSILLAIVSCVVTMAFCAVYYSASWRIFRIFAPDHAAWFTILSVILGPLSAILLIAVRNRKPQNLQGLNGK